MGLTRLMLAAGMILSTAFAFADNGTEFGVDDDLTVWGVDGSTADADVEIKGFTVFGSTTPNNLAVYNGTGSVFVSGALEVSSNTYLRGTVVVGTMTSQGIFAVKDNLVVTSGGNVGIGTASPGALLQVGSTASSQSTPNKLSVDGNIAFTDGARYIILDTNNTGTGSLMLQAGRGSASFGGGLLLYSNSHATHPGDVVAGVSSGSGGAFRVNSYGLDDGTNWFYVGGTNGNVGIGTTGPIDKLDVVSTTAGQALLGIYDNTSPTVGRGGELLLQHQSGTGVQTTYASVKGYAISGTAGGQTGALVLKTMKAGTLTEQVRIDNNGNVGIGTTGPGAKLHLLDTTDISGSNTISNMLRIDNAGSRGVGSGIGISFYQGPDERARISETYDSQGSGGQGLDFWTRSDGGSITEQMKITNTGNVGVGTANPADKLQVANNGALAQIIIGDNSSGSYNALQIRPGPNAKNWIVATGYNVTNSLEFTPSTAFAGTVFTTPAMVIKEGGNVGIGKTPGSYALDVNGTVNAGAYSNNGNAVNTASGLVALDASAKLPAVDGSQLLNIGGGLLKMTVYPSGTNTFTKLSATKKILVEVVGGGGQGGSGQGISSASGGGGGGYARKFITSGLNATETVTVGTGGNGGGAAGAAGGTSSFGSWCSATGGGGGQYNGNPGGAGGTGTGGDININGQDGKLGSTSIGLKWGDGGNSMYGFGGANGTPGGTGVGYGGGGGSRNDSNGNGGGPGAGGVVIVYEYP